nr:diguanylate cyclase [Halorhodospira abdelmalekii]
MLSGISGRLLVGFGTLVVLPVLLLTHYMLAAYERSLTETVVTSMSTLANHNARKIDSYLHERLTDTLLLSQSVLVRSAIEDGSRDTLTAVAREGVELGATEPDATEPDTSTLDPSKLEGFLETFMEQTGYYDVLLIDAAGTVVFSIKQESDLYTNLLSGPYRGTQLASGFRHARDFLTINLTNFDPYPPSGDDIAAFLVAPVVAEGRFLGSVAVQLALSLLDPIITDRTGLGGSGEIVMARLDGGVGRYMVPLRRAPDAVYQRRIPFAEMPPPMQQALSGNAGQGVTYDYVGQEVVAAWRYIPTLRWGMVVKMDAAEALAPVTQLRQLTFALLAAILVVTALTGIAFGRSLVLPMHRLKAVTDAIKAGDYQQRADPAGPREIRQFAQAFNAMAERLNNARAALEARVEERTQELREANARLQVEIEERRHAEARLHHLAHHDPLTNLPNRHSLQDRLTQAIAMSAREGRQLAVLFIDMDRFKAINDTYGHQVGDQLLIQVAERLRENLRASDLAARLGGDEFIAVATQINQPQEGVPVATKLQAALSEPFVINDLTLSSTPSIGLSIYPDDGATAEELIKKADAEMYRVKRGRRRNQDNDGDTPVRR